MDALDESRRIDYGADHQPLGVELLDVSQGVDLRSVPAPDQIADAWKRYHLRIAV